MRNKRLNGWQGWAKTHVDTRTVKEYTNLFNNWVIDISEMLGSEVRVVHKNITRDNGRILKLVVWSLRDVFDKKNEVKQLSFLSTGKYFW